MILEELLVSLGFDYDPEELGKFQSDLNKVNKMLGGLVRAASAAATAITGLTVVSTQSSDEHGKFANEIGEAVEMVDALQFAQRRAGGSSEAMMSSLRGLSQIAGEAARGVGSGVEAFGMLGISTLDASGQLKSTTALFSEISEAIQGLDRSRQIDLVSKLGLSGSIRLLQQGPEEIKALVAEAKALGVTTDEDAKIAAEFQDSLTDLWEIINQVTRVIARAFAPTLKSLVNTFSEWWKVNRDIVESKFLEWVGVLTDSFKLLTVAVGTLLAFKLAAHLATIITMMRGLTLATIATNAALFLAPALIMGAITAIAALAEDAKVFFEGGESFIGDMIAKFPEWAREIEFVADIFARIAELTGMIFEGWSKIIDAISSSTISGIAETISNLPGFAADLARGVDVRGTFEGIRGLFGGDTGGTISTSQITNSTQARLSQNIDRVEISVSGAGDPGAVAEAVRLELQQTAQDLTTTVDE